ncbi:hypothetical protein OROGR_022145 [Orobanche gracilis]
MRKTQSPATCIFEHIHSKKRNRLERQKLNDLVFIKYNRALKRRFDMRDTIDPIIVEDAHVLDPSDLLAEEDEMFPGEGLRWKHVEEATGTGETAYGTRSTRTSTRVGETSTPAPRARRLIDEDDDDELGGGDNVEENDVMAYKEVVVTSDQEDEPDYEDSDEE